MIEKKNIYILLLTQNDFWAKSKKSSCYTLEKPNTSTAPKSNTSILEVSNATPTCTNTPYHTTIALTWPFIFFRPSMLWGSMLDKSMVPLHLGAWIFDGGVHGKIGVIHRMVWTNQMVGSTSKRIELRSENCSLELLFGRAHYHILFQRSIQMSSNVMSIFYKL